MKIEREVLTLLSDGKPRTIHEIARGINRRYSSWLRGVVVRLAKDGMIEKTPRLFGAGRPANVYRWRKPEGMSVRDQYRRDVIAGYAYTYAVWLEEQLIKVQGEKR